MDYEFVKTAFITLFVAIDPPGLAPIFLGLTQGMTAMQRNSTAWRSVMIAFIILASAAFCGEVLLSLLGIGLPAFQIAGGLLLFTIAVEMVFEKRTERKTDSAEASLAEDHHHHVAVFPLAIPMIAGPGAITAVILQSSVGGSSILNQLALVGILLVVIGSCLVVFLLATKVDRLLGRTGRIVLSRLLGVLLAALAVQIIGDGVTAFIKDAWA